MNPHVVPSFWNNIEAPNSETEVIIPSIGMIWNHKNYGSFSLNLKYSYNQSVMPESAPDSDMSMFELSIGYRKTIDYTIPWLSDF